MLPRLQKKDLAVQLLSSKAKERMANSEQKKPSLAGASEQELERMRPHLQNKDLAVQLAMDFWTASAISCSQQI